MHILMVIPFYHPATQFGGPVKQLAALCPRIVKQGHEISIVTLDLGVDASTARNQWLSRNGCQIWYQSTWPWNRFAPYICNSLKRPLATALQTADVMHLQLGMTMLNRYASTLSNRLKVPYVYSPRGNLNPQRLQKKCWAKSIFLHTCERPVISHASGYQALTAREAEELQAQGADVARIRQIPNGVSCTNASAPANAEQFRASHAIPLDATVVLYLGQLLWVKGIDLLIRGFSQCRSKNSNLHLVIAGPDAGYEQRARQLARKCGITDRVTFTGHLDGEEKSQAFRNADMFALTSYGEGLPNAALEAAAFCKPLIVTADCNIPEVKTYDAGMIVEPNAVSIATAIDALASDADSRVRQGANAGQMAARCFSYEQVVSQLIDLYRSVSQKQ